jgi:hypothetical protein
MVRARELNPNESLEVMNNRSIDSMSGYPALFPLAQFK